jgi:hypothetical protein
LLVAVALAGDQLDEDDVVALLVGMGGGVEQLALVVQSERLEVVVLGMSNPVTMPPR